MGFNDIFKSSFLENVTAVPFIDMILALLLAFVIGLFIMAIYKKTYTGVLYSQSFGVSLILLTLITTFIILGITSNVILSLGMVGALSIVRFRSAVKEPLDIAYLFWAIGEGIIIGAGLISLAIVGVIFIGITLILFVNKNSNDNAYILVVNCNDENTEKNINAVLHQKVKKYIIKSKTVSAQTGIEITIEVRLKHMTTDFVNEISNISGVKDAVLVSYNGNYMN